MSKIDNIFSDYLHEFAIWTSARAVQRGFATTKVIKQAIENAGIRKFANDFQNCSISDTAFDEKHKELANKLLNSFKGLAVLKSSKEKITYGRMAKIIAIYLKTAVVIPNKGKGDLAKVAHPPIDAILLKELHRKKVNKHLGLNKITWTTLNELDYFELVSKLRETFDSEYFWELEKDWKSA